MKKGGSGRSPLIYIVFVFVLLGAVLSLSMCSSRKPKPDAPVAIKDMDFDTQLEMQRPEFMQLDRECPVDNTKFKVPSQDRLHDNSLGGKTSDLMKIALCPPDKPHGPPGVDCQQFERLLGTCPTCGATFIELDIINMHSALPPEAMSNLNKHWDLAKVAPQLKAIPQEQWGAEERALARYLTARTAWEGAPNLEVELGFSALQGAYCSNLSLYLGRDYKITAAAFYALAAAHFQHALEINPSVPENLRMGSEGQAYVGIMIGEMNRLLGRESESQAGYSQARQAVANGVSETQARLDKINTDLTALEAQKSTIDPADQAAGQKLLHDIENKQRLQVAVRGGVERIQMLTEVIDELEGYLKQGDHELHRFTQKGAKAPPIGWYVDQMLPGINGELDVQRSKWAAMSDPAEIATAMLAEIGPAGAPAAAEEAEAPAEQKAPEKPSKPPTM